MYVCMFVCLYVCMYVCMYVHLYLFLSPHSYSSLLTSFTLVSANGSIITASPTENADLFYAASTSVGIFGVISTGMNK